MSMSESDQEAFSKETLGQTAYAKGDILQAGRDLVNVIYYNIKLGSIPVILLTLFLVGVFTTGLFTIASRSVEVVTSVVSSPRLNGTYVDATFGMGQYTFLPSGKVRVKSFAGEMETDYTFDGKEVKVEMQDGVTQVFRLNEDGSITGPAGIILVKRE